MTEVSERAAKLESNKNSSWERKLIAASNNNWESAAIADLAFDGQTYTIDLRRAPFAGNEDLKAAAIEARDAHARLQRALVEVVFRNTDHQNGDQL